MDDAFCGGGDTNEGLSSTAIPISAAAVNKIAAAIFMGDPRHIPGLSYNVGTCQASGVSTSPSSSLGLTSHYANTMPAYAVRTPSNRFPMPICLQDSIVL
jgi:acetylxylan esterase